MGTEQNWEIRKYVTISGISPFDEWFDTLTPQTQARIDVRLDRVRLGNFGDRKSLGSGLYELRLHFGAGIRVYYGVMGKRVVLLLAGGKKSSQKKDIKGAQRLWESFQNEKRGG